MVHVEMTLSMLQLLVHVAATWSTTQIHGPYCSDIVYAAMTWSLLQWRGPCYSYMILAAVTWSML